MIDSRKKKSLKPVLLVGLLMSQPSFAHESPSVLSQFLHNMSHAHHAFGGLLLISLLLVAALRLKHKKAKKKVKLDR